jgi:hypothetical protein
MDAKKDEIFFAPNRLYGWDCLEALEKSVSSNPNPKLGCGFIPVFRSKSDCKKQYPGCAITVFKIRGND